MYKGASRNLQWRNGVDRAHPSRGYIDAPTADDTLPDVSDLGIAELRAEQMQLRTEVRHAEQQIAIAKAAGRKADQMNAAARKSVLCLRLGAVNRALNTLDGPNELQRLTQAIREVAGDELCTRIMARARELRGSTLGGAQ